MIIILYNILKKYSLLYILCLYFILAIIYNKWKKYDVVYQFKIINEYNNKSKIYFYPFIGCGFANKIPTLTSTILLSLVSFRSIFIVNWKQLLYYYKLPINIFISAKNNCLLRTFNRKNINVLEDLKKGHSIKIYTYHSYTSYITLFYNITNQIKENIKKNKRKYTDVDMYIQDKFLVPTTYIYQYINDFKKKKKDFYIIGVHIRTGYLSDFGEKDNRFYNNNTLIKYIKTINRIVKSNNFPKIYIISDSTKIREYLITLYHRLIFNFTIPGKICHSGYSMHKNKNINECIIKLVAENYILSECNILIGSRRSTYFGLACRRKIIKAISIN